MGEEKEYRNIFKTTFLFGFVQVFNIVVKIGLHKAVAIFLGANGMGMIGLFNSSINLLKTGAGLGIPQSAVRDISEAYHSHDENRFSRIIVITNHVIICTCVLGILLTVLLSPLLSVWSFGDGNYTMSYVLLSLAVGLNILSEGQLAILKGMRQLRALAKASMLGAVVGLITAVPIYFYVGEKGIVPSLIITAFMAVVFSNYYVRRIPYQKSKVLIKDLFKESSSMVKMGCALMLVSFAGFAFDLIISMYVRANGSLADVGLYSAGTTIIGSYFGIIITAMSTDYYPRISAVWKDNAKLEVELNRQSETGLVLIFPLAMLFVFLSPFFVTMLYSKEFVDVVLYTDYAMLGTIIIVCSNCMGMILLAKQATKIFLWSVFGQRLVLIIVYMLLYDTFQLKGLGYAYALTGVFHFGLMMLIMKRMYQISLSRKVNILLFVILVMTFVAMFCRSMEEPFFKYFTGVLLFLLSLLYLYYFIKKEMKIKLFR